MQNLKPKYASQCLRLGNQASMGLFSSVFSHIQLNKTKPNPHLNHWGSLVHPNHFKAAQADGTRKGMLEMMWRLVVAVAGG